MKKIFILDWILVLVFVLLVFSGIELHIAGHGIDHDLWHNWAVFHVISSLLFLIFSILHVKMHWNWYAGILKNGIAKKTKIR